MVIYLGADHRGFETKEAVKAELLGQGYQVTDLGNTQKEEGDDYVDFASAVAKKVRLDPGLSRGILFCGSGVGMDVTANKFRKVRSVVGIVPDQVYDARHDDDANVLTIATGFTGEEQAKEMVRVFVQTSFAGEERHRRRLEKIAQIENA